MSSNLANKRLHKNLSVDGDEREYIAVIQDIHNRNRQEQHLDLKDMSNKVCVEGFAITDWRKFVQLCLNGAGQNTGIWKCKHFEVFENVLEF